MLGNTLVNITGASQCLYLILSTRHETDMYTNWMNFPVMKDLFSSPVSVTRENEVFKNLPSKALGTVCEN